ncbi:hypothetical protein LAV72_03930 [Lysinibacillus xylanilyticus]|uniref:hypothetical protein n=1 Tax=Lysinibacillus xylanilyticus TaxID=582475 RepID=UPI002B249350|nr:hypothetical protein [Lysinibacillus xylanilyticus]MEB2298774.1 hypothetical protein [Lysinibacillus xylanilyticus]
MKKKIKFFIALFLIAMVSLYFFNEYKTKYLVQDIFDTDSLAEETHDISIIDIERNVKTIKKDSTIFPTFINSLKKLEIKRTSSKFYYTEFRFSMIIYHNNALHNIDINENGLVNFNHKTYEIQNKQSFEDFLEIVKKSTQ